MSLTSNGLLNAGMGYAIKPSSDCAVNLDESDYVQGQAITVFGGGWNVFSVGQTKEVRDLTNTDRCIEGSTGRKVYSISEDRWLEPSAQLSPYEAYWIEAYNSCNIAGEQLDGSTGTGSLDLDFYFEKVSGNWERGETIEVSYGVRTLDGTDLAPYDTQLAVEDTYGNINPVSTNTQCTDSNCLKRAEVTLDDPTEYRFHVRLLENGQIVDQKRFYRELQTDSTDSSDTGDTSTGDDADSSQTGSTTISITRTGLSGFNPLSSGRSIFPSVDLKNTDDTGTQATLKWLFDGSEVTSSSITIEQGEQEVEETISWSQFDSRGLSGKTGELKVQVSSSSNAWILTETVRELEVKE